MPKSVVHHFNQRWRKRRDRFSQALRQRLESPTLMLIFQITQRNFGWLLLGFGTNLLAPFFEGGTFGIILLTLQLLSSNQPPDLSALPLLSSSKLLGLLQPLTLNQLFIGLILLAFLLQVLRSGIIYLGVIASTYLATNTEAQVQRQVYSQILSLSFPWASQHKVGDLIDYVTKPNIYVRFLILYSNNLLVAVLSMIAYLAVLISISLPLSLVAIILFGPLIVFQKALTHKIRQASIQLAQAGADLSQRMVESLQGLRLIHILDRQPWAMEQVDQALAKTIHFSRRQNFLVAMTDPVSEIVAIAALGLFAIFGYTLLSRQGQLLLPQLLVFITACNRLAGQLRITNGLLGSLAQCWGQIERLNQILTPKGKQFVRQGGQSFTELHRQIRFIEVSLTYPGNTSPTLHQLSFQLQKGTVTALVGSSGAGKSSIADLLLGLYQPTSGQIWIDDTDLQELNLSTWRRSVGVVSQDPFIFNDSIAANIRFGNLSATDEQVVAAARIAHAHEFITALPEGYATLIGERGFRLAGGQRQRLALARAILRQPQLLILDEATSALDSDSERYVQAALALFQHERTVLAIAHRLSTIASADQILVLEGGQIVEQGTHPQLLQLQGRYFQLWQLQTIANS